MRLAKARHLLGAYARRSTSGSVVRRHRLNPNDTIVIYLDHNASTPIDERVHDAMLPVLRAAGNAAASHRAGSDMRAAADRAREQISALTGLPASGVVLCSGATEANNLAVAGVAASASEPRRVVLCSSIEHPSVLVPMRALQKRGFAMQEIPVGADGRVVLGALSEMVNGSTLLVSIQAANGEVGTVQPIEDIARIVRAHGALLHVDAAQAAIGLDVRLDAADFVTWSAHKMYGPQGAGALVAGPGVRPLLRPMIVGGGQEGGLRSGTVNVAGAVGLGKACELALGDRDSDAKYLASHRDRLHELLAQHGARLNGPFEGRLPGNLNVRFPGADAEAVMAACAGVAFSAGSACATSSSSPSHVLLALGLTAQEADESLRFAVGRTTTLHDVERAAAKVVRAVASVRDRQQVRV